MHMVTDEHGNPVHGHSHDHHHDHCHPHEETPNAMEETLALVSYMVDHNKHHTMELEEMAGKLKEMGKEEAAGLLEKGVAEFDKGNQYLSQALAALSEK